ncbi:MAG: hypothetical protein J6Y27_08535 [Bacteroidales bacterium]|nr:hypothetical protein [Bacteroidales bacterium]
MKINKQTYLAPAAEAITLGTGHALLQGSPDRSVSPANQINDWENGGSVNDELYM